MKKRFLLPVVLSAFSLIGIFCSDNAVGKEEAAATPKQEKPILAKPPSSYQDTFLVNTTAAVFYHPDSIQLEKIRKLEDSMVYEGTMHEYFYQMRNARIVIKNGWPHVAIIEADNIRYLLFKKKNNETTIIDLDTKGDPHGLFLFDQKHAPEQVDMMNIDNELPRYFYQKDPG